MDDLPNFFWKNRELGERGEGWLVTKRKAPRQNKRRGIRASRARLEHALAMSDLTQKTQIALANRIADLEELEAIPRDLVSRIFREQPVDAHSIERIARALGVESETLYRNGSNGLSEASGTSLHHSPSRSWVGWLAGLAAMAATGLLVMIFLTSSGTSELRCRFQEWISPPRTPPDRLGVVVARFDGTGGKTAQSLLAQALRRDRSLGSSLSVFASCHRYALAGSGDLAFIESKLRGRGRAQLEQADAQILLWGEMRQGRALVRFISRRTDLAPVILNIDGRPLRVEEERLEIPLPIERPGAAISEIKALMIGLMTAKTPRRSALLEEAARAFAMSFDWLRASVVSLRNSRRAIDSGMDTGLWGEINNRLCYEERLLGEIDGEASRFEAALEACLSALEARPRDLFPVDWARTRINLASARIRLHNFADDRAAAISLLEASEADLEAAADIFDPRLTPQLWALARRNLGVVYERLGELTSGSESDGYFSRAIEVTKEALTALNPDFQPVDWSITQQNACLALYQQGLRQGSVGRVLVEEARWRCSLARARLSPEQAPLAWAMVQNNYAVTLAILGEMDASARQLNDAREAFEAAQSVYRRDSLPSNWAEVEINLAELSCHMARLEEDPALLDVASRHGEAALEIFILRGMQKYRRYTEALLQAVERCRSAGLGDCRCRAG